MYYLFIKGVANLARLLLNLILLHANMHVKKPSACSIDIQAEQEIFTFGGQRFICGTFSIRDPTQNI